MGVKREIIFDLLTRFPDVATKTLARKAYNENIEVFKDVENARSFIRKHRGNSGKKVRKELKNKDHYRENQKPFAWNKIPEGEKVLNWNDPLEIDFDRVLVISDLHVPYHDKVALEITLNHAHKKGVDAIYINGDFIDAYQLSRWVRDPRLRSFAEELKIAKEILWIIRKGFPDIPIYYKVGNHDYRYELYMKLKAPELLDIPEFELKNILGLENMGFEYIANKEWVKINGLPVLHGHEGGQSFTNPVNPARGVFLKTIDSVLIGHHHQPSSHTSKTLRGKAITTFSIGCLCDLAPEYMPVNKWSHGFCYIENDEDGFNVDNKRIVKGKVRSV